MIEYNIVFLLGSVIPSGLFYFVHALLLSILTVWKEVSQWNDLSDPVFDGVGLAGFKSRVNAFLLA